jgi:hypothetical protein
MRSGSGYVAAGLSNSLVGVKYRSYECHSKTHVRDGEREVKYSASIYKQLLLNNPTRSVARGIVEPAPQCFVVFATPANQAGLPTRVCNRRRRHGDE